MFTFRPLTFFWIIAPLLFDVFSCEERIEQKENNGLVLIQKKIFNYQFPIDPLRKDFPSVKLQNFWRDEVKILRNIQRIF